jgi:hypothetical protein
MVPTKALEEKTSGSVGHRRRQREKILKKEKKETLKTKVEKLPDMSHKDHVNYV